MNKLMLIGRITNELELQGSEGKEYLKFTLAVKRQRKREGQPEADFFRCKLFGSIAKSLVKYTGKGKRISVVGRVELGSYEKDGNTVYTTDIMVEDVNIIDFLENDVAESKNYKKSNNNYNDPFKKDGEVISVEDDEDLPF